MITLNNRPMEYEAGMTIQSLIDRLNYTYPLLTMRINGVLIDDDKKDTPIADGDKVEILHPVLGG